ncbi:MULTISPECIES: glycoside hydrolase family 44 protein [unclassified Undibacterium]|uniref:glycoside hydrolase family 44 protein n=2 Tax=Undibacterium TaxID=401469 RepID=UPI002AC8A028|nr:MULTISPECIES: glycoside hydrolase family 44 protein [unclassified Undibacterium]MEB0138170.1 glycoside hydrolase family 44 protein [Undibacterium sp. CCC2.1]MEB0171075.1 glycoside hydrolase family 44 protein [Undibacterium sp. CCC1.1]MEB0175120.1 glycoside hydrolase family 44 protein [Undibacterium sp. CCC3.4]MEB0214296.1 glycoside hydrolase family 44 protein [Undibacterium sp. 5I2]WPX41876.1 glycoside hydrolase family 44 protein [Undibacterium sp. CCC3.4]
MNPSKLFHLLTLCACAGHSALALAQSVTLSVDTQSERKAISPLIYGYNAYADGSGRNGLQNQGGLANLQELNLVSRRLGGNNMTSYNWENGVSNSGADWCNSSNAGVSATAGAGDPSQTAGLAYYAPGAALKSFQDQSLLLGTYSLLQLPAAGKLPKDIVNLYPPGSCNGSALWQNAPGASNIDLSRWVSIVNDKPASAGALSLQPQIGDATVYIDEELNFLLKNYGAASSAKGVKAYELDNEPDLWHQWPSAYGEGTHPLLYPNVTTVADVLQKNAALAATVKRMDGSAETYGPAVSGYLGLFSLWAVWDGAQTRQPADWASYNVEPFLSNNTGDRYRYNGMTFANVYLNKMKQASTAAGRRLLDTLSFHYYPQASQTPADRVQAARSLWDAAYVEPSWITQSGYGFTDGRGLQVLPKLKQAIADFYPGTKLAVTEYDFGGKDDVSGAIAQADALGAFGRQGVYMASYFGDVEGYIGAGFKLFRNYDGNKSVFPEISVKSASTNNANASVYAAVSATDPTTLHIIAINRLSTAVKASIQIKNPLAFKTVKAWGVDASSQALSARKGIAAIAKNSFSYSLPAQSVLHFVLQP